jgi:hypothetical protein
VDIGILIALTVFIVFLLFIFVWFKKSAHSNNSRVNHRAPPHSGMNQAQTNILIAFLEEADNAYIRAYQYRSLGELIQYITRDLAIEMQQKITYYNDRIWASPSHRKRTWTIVSAEEQIITVRKELTFKNVKYGRMLVKIGDDCVEYWKVIFDDMDKRYKIQEITS